MNHVINEDTIKQGSITEPWGAVSLLHAIHFCLLWFWLVDVHYLNGCKSPAERLRPYALNFAIKRPSGRLTNALGKSMKGALIGSFLSRDHFQSSIILTSKNDLFRITLEKLTQWQQNYGPFTRPWLWISSMISFLNAVKPEQNNLNSAGNSFFKRCRILIQMASASLTARSTPSAQLSTGGIKWWAHGPDIRLAN